MDMRRFALPRITVVEPNGNLVVADYNGDVVHRVLPFSTLRAGSRFSAIGADKYFHCKENCESARRGEWPKLGRNSSDACEDVCSGQRPIGLDLRY